jgi:lipopolysaccharide export system permease protein
MAVLIVLLLIFLGRYTVLYLSFVAEGFISGAIFFDILLLRTISSLAVMVPFGFFLAILIAFGRLYKDSEMTAFAASGVSATYMIRSTFVLWVSIAVIEAVLSLYLSPWARNVSLQVQETAATKSEFQGVVEGKFNTMKMNDDVIVYAEGFARKEKKLYNLFIEQREQGVLEIATAERGYQVRDPKTNERFLVLVDGYQYRGSPGDVDFNIVKFKESRLRIEEKPAVPKPRSHRAQSTLKLLRSGDIPSQAEFEWRVHLPIATLLLAILGVLMSRTSPRRGRFAKIFVAILVFIIYSNCLSIARSWIEQGKVPPALGLWIVQAGVLLVIVFLMTKQYGWQRLRDRFASQ